MRELAVRPSGDGPLRILCVGAHCDDIDIGCGATLVMLQRAGRPVRIDWAVLSGTAERRDETRVSMDRLVGPASRGDLMFGDLADGRFPSAWSAVKDFIETFKARPAPDLVFCHERDDRHQDHRVVNEVVWTTLRDHLVLEYVIPKWDGGLGQPNVYVPIDAAAAETKIEVLMGAYRSQAARDWFTRDTFSSLLRLRGVECRSSSGFAEAFHGRKLLFDAV